MNQPRNEIKRYKNPVSKDQKCGHAEPTMLFRREMGKCVDEAEGGRLEQYATLGQLRVDHPAIALYGAPVNIATGL